MKSTLKSNIGYDFFILKDDAVLEDIEEQLLDWAPSPLWDQLKETRYEFNAASVILTPEVLKGWGLPPEVPPFSPEGIIGTEILPYQSILQSINIDIEVQYENAEVSEYRHKFQQQLSQALN